MAEGLRADQGDSFELQEFSKPVICRNGHTVIIRKVEDQWFLRYSDPDWKARTIQAAASFVTWPADYARELPGFLSGSGTARARGRSVARHPAPERPKLDHRADRGLDVLYGVFRRAPIRWQRKDPYGPADRRVFRCRLPRHGSGEPSVPTDLAKEIREEFL